MEKSTRSPGGKAEVLFGKCLTLTNLALGILRKRELFIRLAGKLFSESFNFFMDLHPLKSDALRAYTALRLEPHMAKFLI